MKLTQRQLAGFLGYTDRQLRNFRKKGMPLDLADPLVVAKCAVWIHENANPYLGGWTTRKAGNEAEGDINAQIKQATLEKLREEAREKRLRNEETVGRLLPADQVEHAISEGLLHFRSRLMYLGGTVATLVPGEVKGTVKKMVEDVVQAELTAAYETLLSAPIPEAEDVDAD